MRWTRACAGVPVAMLACLCLAAGANARQVVFWSNLGASKISYAPLIEEGAGADLQIAFPYVDQPYGTAVDAAAGRIYWLNRGGSGSVGYANLDGSGAGLLNTNGASFHNPAGLAIDPAGGRIYWGNPAAGEESIGYANLNGSGGGLLKPVGATLEPNGIAVDPSAGRIYWSNFTADKISYANLDGSNAHDLDTTGAPIDGPEGVAIDASKGRVYWANWEGDSVGHAAVNGGAGGKVDFGTVVSKPIGVAVDTLRQILYWGSEGFERIESGNPLACCNAPLSVGGATQSIPAFPAILRSPLMSRFPTVQGLHRPSATLSCSPGEWEADQVEAFYYRAPQSFSYQWLRNGKPIVGATAPTVVAQKVGKYNCEVTASNFAGSDTEPSLELAVDATLRLGKTTFNRRKGTATVRLTVTGAGGLAAFGKGVAKAQRKRVSAKAKIVLRAAGKARIELRETGKAKVRATIAYVPEGGKAIKRRKTVMLRKTLRR